MGLTLGRIWLALLGALMLLQGEQQPTPKANPPGSTALPVLPGFEPIVAVYDDLKKALDQARPNSVILSAEQYEALLERLQKLEKAAPERRPFFLNACRISGQITAASPGRLAADIRLDLEFRTTDKDVVLPLGLKGARLTRATLDGEPPLWLPHGDALALFLKEPKVYRLTVQLQPAVTQIGQESRLLIENLPQAAITTLDVTVPAKVTAAQVVASGAVTVEPLADGQSRLRSDALGVLTQLDLRWQTPTPEPEAGQIHVTVHAETQASIEETVLDTESRVKIEVRQGTLDRLAFRIPKEISLLQVESEGRSDAVDFSFEPGSGQFLLRPRTPLAAGQAPLEVRVRTQQPFPDKSGKPLAIGLLELLDVPRKQQTGTIALFVAGERRLRFQPVEAFRIDPREVSTANRVAVFAARYWRQPARVDLLIEPGATLAAQAAVKPTYVWTFTGRQVHAVFSWEITPRNRTACQEVDLHWPAGFILDRNSLLSGPVESVQGVEGSPETVRVRLAPRQTTRFTLKAEGVFALADGEIHHLPLAFVSRITTERDNRLEPLQLLPERGELRLVCQAAEVRLLSANLPLVGENGSPVALPLRCGPSTVFALRHPEAANAHLEVSAQPLRHQVQASADVCVTSSAWELEQRLQYRFVGAAPSELWLRVPRGFHASLQAAVRYRDRSGQTLQTETALTERGPRPLVPTDFVERLIPLPAEVGETCEVVLRVTQPLPAEAGMLSVSFITPGPQERVLGPVAVQVWASSEVTVAPDTADSAWVVSPGTPTEAESVPDWQLHAPDLLTPLRLQRVRAEQTLWTTLVVDQARFDVLAPRAGRNLVRAWLRLDPAKLEQLVLRLPLERSGLRLERLAVNGLEQQPEAIRDSEDGLGHTELVLRLLPRHLRGPVEVEATLPWPAGLRPFGIALGELPVIHVPQADAVHHVVWRVETARGSLPVLWEGDAEPRQAWRFQGWLQAPLPVAATAAAGTSGSSRPTGHPASAYEFEQRGSLDPPSILTVPRMLWTLAWSSLLFIVAVLMFYAPRSLSVAVLFSATCLLLALLFWNAQVGLAAIYGMQPGAALAIGLLSLAWARRQRWRRKVTYLPGFTRSSAEVVRTRSSVQRMTGSGLQAGSPSNGSTRIRETSPRGGTP